MMEIEPSAVISVFDEMASSLSSVRQVIQSLNDKSQTSPSELDMKDGVSLLSLKHHVLVSYLQSLVLLSSRRAIGHTLSERSSPSEPFSDQTRGARGDGAGDLVESMIEGRIVLEKIKVLEGRMRYQIDKLVKVAQEKDDVGGTDAINDPLSFRPNPQNLVSNADEAGDSDEAEEETPGDRSDGIYRPPRLAPMPYVPTMTSKDKRDKRASRAPIPKSLSALMHTDPLQPHAESTSGLGNTPSLSQASSRAKYLKRLTEFEESQFGRVLMGKKESRRRQRDEEEMALGSGLAGIGEDGRGGGATGSRWRKGGGWEDEFGDVLRDTARSSGKRGDGYDELRQKGKRASVLERSRASKKRPLVDVEDSGRKRSRFEKERKNVKKRKL